MRNLKSKSLICVLMSLTILSLSVLAGSNKACAFSGPHDCRVSDLEYRYFIVGNYTTTHTVYNGQTCYVTHEIVRKTPYCTVCSKAFSSTDTDRVIAHSINH